MIARLLISSNSSERQKFIKEILGEEGFKNPHPDLLYFQESSKLGIEQARAIKGHFSLKPYQSKGRSVVLADATNLTIEAQNALLKTIEELPKDALFILGADSDAKLLPTVVSRCQIINLQDQPDTPDVDNMEKVEKLLAASMEERFEYIEKLKNREEFLHFLIQYFHQNLRSHLKGEELNFLKELIEAEKWAAQNVNIRAILEYLMLKMPKAR
ncbi:hypothetical protein HYS96_02955 [Candidatus Daviesbacteria bacterium]|nr:hypothetical protein [Candidatus Daviesbacteria bacterium]